MELLEPDEVPLTINEDILSYLKDQNLLHEEDEGFFQNITNFTENQIKDILEELLQKFETIQKLKDDYEDRVRAHNQYPLFNLKNLFPDFEIDDEMYNKLTFRETLIIQNLNSDKGYTSEPVGGLCLDIQKAPGEQPARRKCPDIEAKLAQIMKRNDKDVVPIRDINISDHTATDEASSAEDLQEFEGSLVTQADRHVDKFLVHLSSQFGMDGNNAGSSMTTWVDRNLHTLEEARKEFYTINNVDKPGEKANGKETEKETSQEANQGSDQSDQNDGEGKDEKKLIYKSLYVGLLKKYYYIKHISNADGIDDRKLYSLLKAKDFVSEGASFLLMRYLAINIYIGTFELSCMYINGDMCRNIYVCTGPESELINNHRIDICRIYRTIIEQYGIEHRCTTVLTLQGQIVHQTWDDCPYILQINPLLDISNYNPVDNERVLLKHAWESDMQLMSKYLDQKIATEIKIKSYMIDHPEFRNMISDYIHAILLLKPEDIIEFTINHFLSFAPQFMPQNDYINY